MMRNRRIHFALCALLALALAVVLAAGTFAAEDHGGVAASGKCGDNLKWTLYGDGLLEISGTGEMWDYDNESAWAPWREYSLELRSLRLNEGLTAIGDYAFGVCWNFKGSLVIPESVIDMEENVFKGCTGLTCTVTNGSCAMRYCEENGIPYVVK